MVTQTTPTLLVELLSLLDHVALAPEEPRRGRPCRYPERLFVKLVIVMVVREVSTVHGVLALLAEPALAEARAALARATPDGVLPSRRTCERRLARLAGRLSAQVAALGADLLPLLEPWAEQGGRALALDSTPLRAQGRVWHQRERRAGVLPHTRIDTEAHWTHSGWHGWVYGYKLHLLATVSPTVWLPLAAAVTPANVADNVQAAALLPQPGDAPVVPGGALLLADVAYADPQLRQQCIPAELTLVTNRRGPRPHHDGGVGVRRVFHALRSQTSEGWNAQFKRIFACREQLPTRGLHATRRFVLGGVLIYQLTLLHRWLTGGSLRRGLSAAIRAL
jgi:hypothetical protein